MKFSLVLKDVTKMFYYEFDILPQDKIWLIVSIYIRESNMVTRGKSTVPTTK